MCQITNMHETLELPTHGRPMLSLHRHRNLELHYIARGQCTFVVGERIYTLHAGQLLLVPPDVLHHMHGYSDDLVRTAIPLTMKLSKTASDNDRSFHHTIYTHDTVILEIGSTHLEAAIERIRELIRTANYPSSYARACKAQACCSLMLLELFELLNTQNAVSSQANTSPTPSCDFQIDEWLTVNYNRSTSTASHLAKKLNLSPRQLNRVMKRSFGLNYRDRVKQLRLESAINLLVTTNRSIASIAEEAGYDSPSNFSAFIKKATGKTPSQIRKEAR